MDRTWLNGHLYKVLFLVYKVSFDFLVGTVFENAEQEVTISYWCRLFILQKYNEKEISQMLEPNLKFTEYVEYDHQT